MKNRTNLCDRLMYPFSVKTPNNTNHYLAGAMPTAGNKRTRKACVKPKWNNSVKLEMEEF